MSQFGHVHATSEEFENGTCFLVIVKVMTNHLNFKLRTAIEKNPEPSQNNTDSHEAITKPFMQNDTSKMQ